MQKCAKNAPQCAKTTLACTKKCANMHQKRKTCSKNALRCAKKYIQMRKETTRMRQNAPRCTRMHNDAKECSRTVRMHQNGRECQRMPEDTQNAPECIFFRGARHLFCLLHHLKSFRCIHLRLVFSWVFTGPERCPPRSSFWTSGEAILSLQEGSKRAKLQQIF